MKIGLIPISAKPYHIGHHYLIERASLENDSVMVYASISDRKRKDEYPILGNTMKEVWNNEILKILPENVEVVFGGSPIRKVYEAIGLACETNETSSMFTIYSDIIDTKSNYSIENRLKYMNPLWENKMVTFAAEQNPSLFIRGSGAPDVRGEDLRICLANNDFITFTKYVPSQIDACKYWAYFKQ